MGKEKPRPYHGAGVSSSLRGETAQEQVHKPKLFTV